ncbi:hypothetical protein [Chromobacterium violaceum]|uniref:hypothetical protein n=1 Tax=Chromobacterium violaceum TaxID=536 RepID=UPI000AC2B684|nr:hypothetical protein [Chromobacterium violaceum]
MDKRNLLENASLNGFHDRVFSFAEGNGYQVQLHRGEKVDGWVVGQDGNGVYACNYQNSGFPEGSGDQVRGGIRLCVDGVPGSIFYDLGVLISGQSYEVKWLDTLDHHHGNREFDGYTVRIDTHNDGKTSPFGLEDNYEARNNWMENSFLFVPKSTVRYCVTFRGKSPNINIKRGAIISNVRFFMPNQLSATDIQLASQPLQLAYDVSTNLAKSSSVWIFRVLNSRGESLDGQPAFFHLIGEDIHFSGIGAGEPWKATIHGDLVELPQGVVLLRGKAGEHSLLVEVGDFSKPFPITIAGDDQHSDWQLKLEGGKPSTNLSVGGSFLFVFSLKYKGEAQKEKTLEVAAVNADRLEPLPSKLGTQENGQASLLVVATKPGKAEITVTHAASGSSIKLTFEISEAVARQYLLELLKPASRKLAVSRQDAVQIQVSDAKSKTPASGAIKVVVVPDAAHDVAQIEWMEKTVETRNGIAEFLATPKAVGTSHVVFQIDPAGLAAPLPVALTAQTNAGETQLTISPEAVDLLPNSVDDKHPVHVFFDPPLTETPATIGFQILESGSSLRVRQGNLQLLAGELKVGSGGEAILQSLEVGAEAPGTTLHILFRVRNREVQPCVLTVTIAAQATSAKLMPAGTATEALPLIADWRSLISLSGCYVLVDGQQAGVSVEFHLVTEVEKLVEFAAPETLADRLIRTVKTKAGGRAALPDIMSGDGVGKFHVDVYLVGSHHRLGSFHFSVEQPRPAQAVVFSDDPYAHLLPGRTFNSDYVTVYSDLNQRTPLHGGTVHFDLDDSKSSTGSRFVLANGEFSLHVVAPINPHGRAVMPDIRVGEEAGSFDVRASVSTAEGSPLVTKTKTYTIATF